MAELFDPLNSEVYNVEDILSNAIFC